MFVRKKNMFSVGLRSRMSPVWSSKALLLTLGILNKLNAIKKSVAPIMTVNAISQVKIKCSLHFCIQKPQVHFYWSRIRSPAFAGAPSPVSVVFPFNLFNMEVFNGAIEAAECLVVVVCEVGVILSQLLVAIQTSSHNSRIGRLRMSRWNVSCVVFHGCYLLDLLCVY